MTDSPPDTLTRLERSRDKGEGLGGFTIPSPKRQNPSKAPNGNRRDLTKADYSAYMKPSAPIAEDIDMFADELPSLNAPASLFEGAQTDSEGYFIPVEGTFIGNGRYKVLSKIGKGLYGVVLRVQRQNEAPVAIKVIRKHPHMEASGHREFEILSTLPKTDVLLKMYEMFMEAGHLCLVCELLGEDLRTYAHKNAVKIKLDHIRNYAISMFIALDRLRKARIVHADIKPDNFLLSNHGETIKLSDFGTAYHVDDHDRSIDQIVARYYRAPEIVLGTQTPEEQRYHLDTWAVGCTLFELYTNEFLFTGNDNNHLLRQIMETRGRFSQRMLKKSLHAPNYFDQDGYFLFQTTDRKSKALLKERIMVTVTPQRDLGNLLRKYSKPGEDSRRLNLFKELLERCFALNPKDRIMPQEAMEHPFLSYQIKLA